MSTRTTVMDLYWRCTATAGGVAPSSSKSSKRDPAAIPRVVPFSALALTAAVLVVSTPARAAWPTDPAVNLPVCTAPYEQSHQVMVSDGAGGAIVTWQDDRNHYAGGFDIFAQHVLSSGVVDPAWPAGGLAVCTKENGQVYPAIASDGAGGAIVTWADSRGGGLSGIYAQHLLASGAVDPAWPADGRAVCTAMISFERPEIVSDGAGGAIVTWEGAYLVPNNRNIYAQHVLANGLVDPAWPALYLAVCTASGTQRVPSIVSDGAGGAIVTWEDYRTVGNASDIYAQRVRSSGVVDPAWPANGRALCTAALDQLSPAIVADGGGGAIVAWEDHRGNPQWTSVYAQRVLASGAVNWFVDGVALWMYGKEIPKVVMSVTDGAGGAIVTWQDGLVGDANIFARRVKADGGIDWTGPSQGVLCVAAGDQLSPTILADGTGGAIVTWYDRRGDTYFDIYAQHALASGVVDPVWPANGRPLCTAANDQQYPTIASDGVGGAIVAWQDYRNGTTTDIYAQRVSSTGILGPSFSDIGAELPGVSGGAVAWGDYDNDGDLDFLLTGYTGSEYLARLYRNDGGNTFSWIAGAGLPGVSLGSVAWGDYDGDGDLDLLITGWTGSGKISRVYRNNGETLSLQANLQGVYESSVAWGDYDNDGDLDILLTGNVGDEYYPVGASMVYRNEKGIFVPVANPLEGVFYGAVAWGDYDNDGDLDILLTGNSGQDFYGNRIPFAEIYRNNGGLFEDVNAGLTGVVYSSVAWGDYDNDGYLDILMAGSAGTGGADLPYTAVWRNDKSVFHEITGTGLPNVYSGPTVAWADYDNDGDLDILLAGETTGGLDVSRVYRNDGEGFVDIGTGLTGAIYSAAAWGDYDNDGDLDILLTGIHVTTRSSRIYVNYGVSPNTSPAAPGGLSASVVGDQVTLYWLTSEDLQTPYAGLSYNVRIGTTPGGNEISPAMAAASGWRRVVQLGNAQLGTSQGFKLPLGGPYYWSVQAVDGAFAGGPFATEGSFVLADFVDATSGPLGDTGNGTGVAWGDHDNDGDLDLYLANAGTANRLFRNDGGGVFVDATNGLPLGDTGAGTGVAWGDYDNDGDLDLYLANWGQANKLFRNNGGGVFVDATSGPLGDTGKGNGVAWGDYDNDGDLDLYLAKAMGQANKLLRNDGEGVFVDATSGPLGDTGDGHGVAWGDYDSDGDLDLYLANNGQANKLFRNDGGGVFVDATIPLLGDTGNGHGVAWGDYDNDGDLDLYLANWGANKLFRNDGGGAFTDATSGPLGDAGNGQGVAWADYDNDGDLDLYLANNGQANKMFRNDGGSGFVDVTGGPLGDTGNGYGVAWGDYDNDGDLDLYLANWGSSNRLFRNENANGNHWLQVKLVGAVSNRSGIGARVKVVAGGVTRIREISGGSGYLSQNSLTASFGLGAATSVTLLEVRWPSGIVQTVSPPPAVNTTVTVTEMGTGFVDATSGPLGDTGNGRGVAWGDYDNDGDLDLYLTNYGQANKLFRNDGGTFADVTSGPLGDIGNGRAGVWGDYDNDGDLDLYLANYGQANKLFRNDGGGGFVDATSGPLGDTDNGRAAAWGDYDRDGDLDLYLANHGQANKLFRNDGGGVFVNATSGPLGDTGYGSGVAWGDYDNDGDLDLYLANGFGANRLFRNDGGGVFADATSGPLGDTGNGEGVAWGDYDNDGDLDLYLANYGQANKLFRNDGGGVFVDATSGPLGDTGNGTGVAWGDYDNDGDLDLYLANAGTANKLFRNNGGGVFVDATSGPLGGTGNGHGVAWGDYDNDGDLDLYLANNGQANTLFRNLNANGNHWLQVKLQGVISNRAGIGARVRVVAGGVSRIQEVSGGSGYCSQNSLVAQFGLGASTTISLLEVRWPSGIVQTVSPPPAANTTVTVTETETETSFVDATSGPLGNTGDGQGVAWGDYDNDGDLDLYLANGSGQANKLFRNDGGGMFVDATSGPLGNTGNGGGVAWGDYDNDGDVDLYLANRGQANKLFRNDGGGVFVDATSGPLGDTGQGRGVAWGDYDNDGDLDLYLANYGTANKLFRNEGGGAFVDATSGPLGDTGLGNGVAWGDYDGDGDLDLYLANAGANKLFRNDGGGAFVDATSGPLGDTGNGAGVAWGDFDNDGDLDLYLANILQANKLFRNDGGGAFVDATSGPLGDTGNGRGVAWADYDNDADLDLYLANYGTANKLFRNEGGGAFADATSGPLGDTGYGQGVAWGDYDNDGDLDLYLSNLGANKLFRNMNATGNHWLQVNLVGTVSNRSGIGARVKVVAGGVTQIREVSGGSGFLSQCSLTAEFGLGAATSVTLLEVRWPSGIVQTVSPPPAANTTVTVVEALASFVDATSGPLGDTGNGTGVAWGDYDNDGDLDLYLSNLGQANKLFRNDGGGVFADATSSPLGDMGQGTGVAWGDYDNDGDLDLYLANIGANRLFRNDGGGVFVDATSGPLGDAGYGRGVAWGDYDNDGDVDLYLVNAAGQANKLFRNDGGGAFVNATSGPLGDTGNGVAAAWGDFDNDGNLDLFLANYGQANKLFVNLGGGVFADVTSGPLGAPGPSMGVAWGDYDNDGDLDLYLANFGYANKLFRNDGGGVFVDATSGPLGDTGLGRGVAWGDYDNDGNLDLYLTNEGANKLLRNDGGGVFVDATSGPLGDNGNGHGVAWGDYDNDGDPDLYLANYGSANKLLRNMNATGNHWLQVKLVGAVSNRSGIGARVKVVAGGVTRIREISGGSGYLSQDALTASFGLGAATSVTLLEVRWPSGIVQTVSPPPAVNTTVTVTETNTIAVSEEQPRELSFTLASGNPVVGELRFRFALPSPAWVGLSIYDISGRCVATLVGGELGAGQHTKVWESRGAGGAPGVYFARLTTGGRVVTRRFVVLR